LERSGLRRHFHPVSFLTEIAMKTAIPVVTAAVLALCTGPAFAGHSTAKEREVTRQLNIQAAQDAKNSNQQSASTSASMQSPAAAPTTPVEGAALSPEQPASPAEPANPAAPAQ